MARGSWLSWIVPFGCLALASAAQAPGTYPTGADEQKAFRVLDMRLSLVGEWPAGGAVSPNP